MVCGVFAPLASTLMVKIGVRPMIFISAILLTAGQLLTSTTTKIWHPFLTYTILSGTSIAIVYNVCWGVLPLYFQKKRSLACGVTNCGKYLGMAVVGPMSRMAMKDYGWRTSLQLFSILGLVMIICGVIYRPPMVTSKTNNQREKLRIAEILLKSLKLHRNLLFILWALVIVLIYSAFFVPTYHIVSLQYLYCPLIPATNCMFSICRYVILKIIWALVRKSLVNCLQYWPCLLLEVQ